MRMPHGLLCRDDGVVLPLVMGIISVLTVISVASFALASNALHETTRTQGETVAFQIANAGVDAALEQVYRSGFVEDNFPASADLSGGTYVVEVERLDNSEFQLTSVGTDATGFTETVVVRFFYINLWEMVFAAGTQESLTAGGGGITGNSNVTGPFYVRGTVNTNGAAYIHNGPWFVDGNVSAGGNTEIGSTTNPIQVYVSGSYNLTGNATDYLRNFSVAVPKLELPRLGADELLIAAGKAQAESIDNLIGTPEWSAGPNYEAEEGVQDPLAYDTIDPPNTAGFTREYARKDDVELHRFGYKYIGESSSPSEPRQGSSSLVIGPWSFGAWPGNGYPVDSTSNDDFAYDAATRTLYVEGTVFVDGPVTFTEHIRYRGRGTIVANGDVLIQGALHPDNTGATEAERRKMGPRHVLGIATPGNITVQGPTGNVPKPEPTDPPYHSLAMYAAETIAFTTNNYYVGSIVAGQINMGNNNVHLVTDPDLPEFLPDSLPGRDTPILTKGAWARQ